MAPVTVNKSLRAGQRPGGHADGDLENERNRSQPRRLSGRDPDADAGQQLARCPSGGRGGGTRRRGATAVRALVIMAAVGCCLGAAAYAATRPTPPAGRGPHLGPLRPRITEHPGIDDHLHRRQVRLLPAGPTAAIGLTEATRCASSAGSTTVNGKRAGCRRAARRSASAATASRFEPSTTGDSGPTAGFDWRGAPDPRRSRRRPNPRPRPGRNPTPAPPSRRRLRRLRSNRRERRTPDGAVLDRTGRGSLARPLPRRTPAADPVRIENPNPTSISVASLTARSPPIRPVVQRGKLRPRPGRPLPERRSSSPPNRP